MFLRQAMSTPQDAELLAERRHGLASRLVTALNVIDRLPFCRDIHGEKVAALEQLPYPLVGAPLCRSPRIFTVTSYRHRHTSCIEEGRRQRRGMNAVMGHTVDPGLCHRHTIFRGFPGAAHPILT